MMRKCKVKINEILVIKKIQICASCQLYHAPYCQSLDTAVDNTCTPNTQNHLGTQP